MVEEQGEQKSRVTWLGRRAGSDPAPSG
jgi:hypothetical protein